MFERYIEQSERFFGPINEIWSLQAQAAESISKSSNELLSELWQGGWDLAKSLVTQTNIDDALKLQQVYINNVTQKFQQVSDKNQQVLTEINQKIAEVMQQPNSLAATDSTYLSPINLADGINKTEAITKSIPLSLTGDNKQKATSPNKVKAELASANNELQSANTDMREPATKAGHLNQRESSARSDKEPSASGHAGHKEPSASGHTSHKEPSASSGHAGYKEPSASGHVSHKESATKTNKEPAAKSNHASQKESSAKSHSADKQSTAKGSHGDSKKLASGKGSHAAPITRAEAATSPDNKKAH